MLFELSHRGLDPLHFRSLKPKELENGAAISIGNGLAQIGRRIPNASACRRPHEKPLAH